MHEPKQPLAEVFGFLTTDLSPQATRYRTNRLCPFNNRAPNCTKEKATNPLGVCSIHYADEPIITCPIRFREDWHIVSDAAAFFFPAGAAWTSLTEVRLNDGYGRFAGNIDMVLVAYDDKGKIVDFGALEIQTAHISGNVREPFEHYMQIPGDRTGVDWSMQPNHLRPDYLSSLQNNLAPRIQITGGTFSTWQKKTAVAINKGFYSSLPTMPSVDKADADIAWLIYDLHLNGKDGAQRYELTKIDEVYTRFEPTLRSKATPVPGANNDFMRLLEEKLDGQLLTPPTA